MSIDADASEEGINGTGLTADIFSKRLPDDCVEFTILIIDSHIKAVTDLRQSLKAIQDAARDLTKKHLKDYIWQRDSFSISFSQAAKPSARGLSPLTWTLSGTTNFGDSISDEWLIVWLLRTLSAQFPSAWIRVEDTDGEFLLVEAANKLPKWLNPEIADHRVWMNDGKLKIIPLPSEEGTQSSNLSLEQAVDYLSKSSSQLLHDQGVEDEAFFRLRNYPSAINTSLHRTLTRIPRRLAHILHSLPAHISPAVESFYLRDPISLKPLATKDTGTLLFPPEDFVTVSTRFTRVGYAQLRSQDFSPPPSWTAVIPHMDDPKIATGMKLTCGFEMLLRDAATADKRCVREVQLLLADLDSGDDTLPTDADIASWDKTQDDEKWLDIDYADLERELRGSGDRGSDQAKAEGEGGGFGDAAAQANLRKLVERFETFMADEKAGPEGVEDSDYASSSASDSDDEGEDEAVGDNKREAETEADKDFASSMREVHNLSATDAEHQDLSAAARELALEMEDEDEGLRDEDDEAKEVMRMAEEMLAKRRAARAEGKDEGKGKGKQPEDDDEELLEGEYELSSDEDEGENDVDLDLLKNVLASFGGEHGMSGPAGNVLAQFGVKMPRDEAGGK
ncbi:SGT1-domain-containing protein [Myriangium duriaei CBS 260.36]|uniref:SGT1-domain-containing protein n=1 Tax=Myriangium duriaei CBS 260.36 TaxID=1168546 RepID=A0A9P4J4C6_9PEZI|nr:SGT1-domain-containing protein [Myriangium duriaei CBS 260.36]